MIYIVLLACLLLLALSLRVLQILPSSPRRISASNSQTCKLAVFLGSGKDNLSNISSNLTALLNIGGHTSEALSLVSTLDFARYTPRLYIISEGDSLSAQKAYDLEKSKSLNVFRLSGWKANDLLTRQPVSG